MLFGDLVFPPPVASVRGRRSSAFDVIAFGGTMGVAITASRSTAQVTKRLYEMERLIAVR